MEMSNEMESVLHKDRIGATLLRYEEERFYNDEAALLDAHEYVHITANSSQERYLCRT